MRYIVMGDFHIPTRADAPPQELLNFLQSEEFDYILITGDLVRFYVIEKWFGEFWKRRKIIGVYGNMDYEEVCEKFPEYNSFKVGDTRILLYHGTGIYPRGDPAQLADIARKFNAKVIVTGHTHAPVLRKFKDIIIINPGSATGVFGGSWEALGIPSFTTLEFKGNILVGEIYIIQDFEIKRMERKEFSLK